MTKYKSTKQDIDCLEEIEYSLFIIGLDGNIKVIDITALHWESNILLRSIKS